jgi:hypothetical protein
MFIARMVLMLTALLRIAGRAMLRRNNAPFVRAMKALRHSAS